MERIIKYTNFYTKSDSLFENQNEQNDIFISGSMQNINPVIKLIEFFNKKTQRQESLDDILKVLNDFEFEYRVSYDDNQQVIRINLNDRTTSSYISFSIDKNTKTMRTDYKLDKDIEDVHNYIDYIECKLSPSDFKKTLQNLEKVRANIKQKRTRIR